MTSSSSTPHPRTPASYCQCPSQTLDAPLAEQEISVELAQSAIEQLLEDAWDPHYGARPLRRHVEKTIGTSLSKKILSGELQAGQDVCISAENGRFIYEMNSAESTQS